MSVFGGIFRTGCTCTVQFFFLETWQIFRKFGDAQMFEDNRRTTRAILATVQFGTF
jgi:hypothetical protein